MHLMVNKTVAGFMVGAGLICFSMSAWAEQSADMKSLIEMHREAAADAQKQATFHEEMKQRYAEHGGKKEIFDMSGHCKYWADYYKKLATKEEQAVKELEKVS